MNDTNPNPWLLISREKDPQDVRIPRSKLTEYEASPKKFFLMRNKNGDEFIAELVSESASTETARVIGRLVDG